MKTVRCAIYTRKSSEEGLEQDFNSLDAQRESCAAYILSQASEGWTLIPDRYDDGGISGGTLARPALQRLLADVVAGRIDIIVVYKVDRLTRSLLDFSRLVAAFEAADTSFVSVTQSFNTTTSMGRLTLNMLLSFAQFEREVTAERIHDKIAASKARGMWMGGTPPLGYAPDGRSLLIIEAHAAIVRDVYARYLVLGNVRLVAQALERDGVRAPRRMTLTGKAFGDVVFSRGQLHAMLKCPTYVGEIHHQGKVHTALHAPVIDRATWDAVQAKLADNTQGRQRSRTSADASLLAGRVVDAAGEPLVATHATKGNARYRYYVSRTLQTGAAAGGLRIPAAELEAAVTQRTAQFFADGLSLATSPWLAVPAAAIASVAARASDIATGPTGSLRATARDLIREVRLHEQRIEIVLDTAAIATLLGTSLTADAPATILTVLDARLTRSGRVMRLVQDNGAALTRSANASLVRLVLKARRWWLTLREGELDITALAAREGVNPAYVTRVVRLAFLAPAVTDAILAGTLRHGVDGAALTATDAIAPLWAAQERAFLQNGS